MFVIPVATASGKMLCLKYYICVTQNIFFTKISDTASLTSSFIFV